MKSFDAIARRKGKYIQVIIPSEIADSENIKDVKRKVLVLTRDTRDVIRQMFGKVKLKRPTQEVLDEMDKGI